MVTLAGSFADNHRIHAWRRIGRRCVTYWPVSTFARAHDFGSDRRHSGRPRASARRTGRGAGHRARAAPNRRPVCGGRAWHATLKGVPEPTALFRLIRASGGGRRSGARQLIRFALYGAFDPVAAAVVAGMMVLFFLLAVIGYDPQRGMLRRAAQAQPA